MSGRPVSWVRSTNSPHESFNDGVVRVVAPDNRIVESDEWIGGIVEGPVVTNWVLDTLHQLGRHESFNDRSHGSTRNLDVSGKLAGGMVP